MADHPDEIRHLRALATALDNLLQVVYQDDIRIHPYAETADEIGDVVEAIPDLSWAFPWPNLRLVRPTSSQIVLISRPRPPARLMEADEVIQGSWPEVDGDEPRSYQLASGWLDGQVLLVQDHLDILQFLSLGLDLLTPTKSLALARLWNIVIYNDPMPPWAPPFNN